MQRVETSGKTAGRGAASDDSGPVLSDDRAWIVDHGALSKLAPSGDTHVVTTVSGASRCDVDRTHGVVWLVGEHDIWAYDARDGTVHRIVQDATTIEPWAVRHAQGDSPHAVQTAGNADELEHCVALVIGVDDSPSVGGEAIAFGDREVYCFEFGEAEDDPAARRLVPEAAKTKAGYDRAELVDRDYLVRLAGRRDAASQSQKPEAPDPPTVAVDPSHCQAAPEACGSLSYVGGGRLWWVVTSNSRGDFFHETRQLYDTRSETYWDPATGRRSSEPLGDAEAFLALEVSPDKKWGVHDGKILSLVDAETLGRFDGEVCGFAIDPVDAERRLR